MNLNRGWGQDEKGCQGITSAVGRAGKVRGEREDCGTRKGLRFPWCAGNGQAPCVGCRGLPVGLWHVGPDLASDNMCGVSLANTLARKEAARVR